LVQLGLGWTYCLSSGQLDLGVEQLQLAVQGDPLHLTCRAVLGRCLTAAGHYEETEDLLLQSLKLEPDFFWTHCYLAELNVTRGRIAEALPYAEKTFSLAPWYAQGVGLFAAILFRLGSGDQAGAVLQTLGDSQAYGVPLGHAVFHTLSGEFELAADWFASAIEQRDSHVLACLQGGIGKPIRASRHWTRLAALANLPTLPLTL
jgi:tetratricopeptide (TPR) repeat protein